MPTPLALSPQFLTDLELVCPQAANELPEDFLADLESAYGDALAVRAQRPAITVADLNELEGVLTEWRLHHQRLLADYLKKLPKDDPLLSPVSLFGTMDYGRLETAHTRALAWLLHPRREHGFGSQLLVALLRHLRDDRAFFLTEFDELQSEYPLANGRIDILGKGAWEEDGRRVPWLLIIEAKIDAEEGELQLSQYDEWIEQHHASTTEIIRVFLTPDGRAAESTTADWEKMTFLELAGILRRVSGLEGKPGYHYLRYYLTGVFKEICELPVPIMPNCCNPYVAVQYLQSVLGERKPENTHGESR